MIMTDEINNCKVNIPKMENEKYGRLFCNKSIYKLSDFDCLVDEKTFNLFTNLCVNDYNNYNDYSSIYYLAFILTLDVSVL